MMGNVTVIATTARGKLSPMSKYGLLSDSHGQAIRTSHAAKLLIDAGAEVLLHMGDLGSIDVLDAIASAGKAKGVELRVVYGNVDWNTKGLTQHARQLGITVDHPMGWLQPAGGDLVYLHGDNADNERTAIAAGVRYLCHGHTHMQCDHRVESTRVINPGALHRTQMYTVALLDTEQDMLTFFPVT